MRRNPKTVNRDLEHSRPFDVHTWSLHPHVNMFVNDIHERYGFAEKNIGKHNLKKILIDLYLAWADDPDLCIAFHRNNNNYSTGTRNNKLHISKKIPDLIDDLSEMGLVDEVPGFYKNAGKSRLSRMWPTAELIDHFKRADLNKFYFTNGCHSAVTIPESMGNIAEAFPEFKGVEDRECIILKQKNPKPNSEEKQIPIQYKDNKNTRQMRAELIAYNSLLVRSHIDLPFLKGPYLEIRNEARMREGSDNWRLHQLLKRIFVNQHFKFTTRQFANKSWKQGGRFYGGWWQQIPSEYREDIRINNCPTIEIDYSGHHPVLLYAQAGINYWSEIGGDVYDVPEADFFIRGEDEQRKADSRLCLKYLVNMLINSETQEDAMGAFRKRIIDNHHEWVGFIRWRNEDLREFIIMLEEKHEPIAHQFGSGAGVKLQYIDSVITSKLLKYFTEREVVVLPIHDSYVIQDRYGDELRLVMEELWREQIEALGAKTTTFDPVFKTDFDISPKLKQIGYYDELFDPEEEGGGIEHKALKLKKTDGKLSQRYMEEWMEFTAFSAEQGWPHSKGMYDFYLKLNKK